MSLKLPDTSAAGTPSLAKAQPSCRRMKASPSSSPSKARPCSAAASATIALKAGEPPMAATGASGPAMAMVSMLSTPAIRSVGAIGRAARA